jgi:four helix bundle protein
MNYRKQDAGLTNGPSRRPARSFADLEVWRKAHAFVLAVYRFTAAFPAEERYGLTSQFRRAAVSIPANVAEGFRRHGAADKARFFNTAEGSLEECRYFCILSEDLGYGKTLELRKALDGLAGQLAAYIRRLREK